MFKWSKGTVSGRDFCANLLGRTNVKQPTLALGGRGEGTYFLSPTHLCTQPKSRTGLFLSLTALLRPIPISTCLQLPHPETPMLGLSPFSPQLGGLAVATCRKLLSIGPGIPVGCPGANGFNACGRC